MTPHSEPAAATPPGQLRVTVGSTALVIETDPDALRVYSKGGQLLDPAAAEVLISLGGDPPGWLSATDGLRAVHRYRGADPQALRVAADALSRSRHDIARYAKTVDEPIALTALAGAGYPQVAANPNCTATAWDLLMAARDDTVTARARATGTTLPPALADHPDVDVRLRVARNPICPPATLDHLAHNKESAVRVAVAANRGTAPATLGHLVANNWPDEKLLAAVAAHRATPARSLRLLAGDRRPSIRANVAANPSFPRRRAARMMWDSHARIRVSLAGRPDLSPTALSWLERYARRDKALYRQTLWRLANNPASSARLIKRVECAQRQLAKPRPRKSPVRFKRAVGAACLLYLPILGLILLLVAVGSGHHNSNVKSLIFPVALLLALYGRTIRRKYSAANKTRRRPPTTPDMRATGTQKGDPPSPFW